MLVASLTGTLPLGQQACYPLRRPVCVHVCACMCVDACTCVCRCVVGVVAAAGASLWANHNTLGHWSPEWAGKVSPLSPQRPRGAAPRQPVGFRGIQTGLSGLDALVYPVPFCLRVASRGLLGPQTDWWERETSPASPPWADQTPHGAGHTHPHVTGRGGWGGGQTLVATGPVLASTLYLALEITF